MGFAIAICRLAQDETEQLDDAQGNVLLHMISQLVSMRQADECAVTPPNITES
jgi:hypothetical protein